MYKRKNCLTWEEISSIINADDSELEDEEEEIEENNSFVHRESPPDIEIEETPKIANNLMDILMQDDTIDNIEEQISIEEIQEIEVDFMEEIELDFIEENPTYNITAKADIKWRKRSFDPESSVFVTTLVTSSMNRTPYEIFKEYVPEKLILEMAMYTNIYALQKGAVFKHTDPEEITKLLGMHILMGVMKFPQIKMYWSNALNINSISSVMSRDRFFLLRAHLHLIDNNTIPPNCDDKFIKVRPLINAVLDRCHQIPVEEIVSVDEQMIPFKGHLSIKQYIKNKPRPWGIKVFVLAGKSGYPYDFILYQGSTTKISTFDKASLGFGAALVLHLCSRLIEPGHQLYFDNYFSSFQLFEIQRKQKLF